MAAGSVTATLEGPWGLGPVQFTRCHCSTGAVCGVPMHVLVQPDLLGVTGPLWGSSSSSSSLSQKGGVSLQVHTALEDARVAGVCFQPVDLVTGSCNSAQLTPLQAGHSTSFVMRGL